MELPPILGRHGWYRGSFELVNLSLVLGCNTFGLSSPLRFPLHLLGLNLKFPSGLLGLVPHRLLLLPLEHTHLLLECTYLLFEHMHFFLEYAHLLDHTHLLPTLPNLRVNFQSQLLAGTRFRNVLALVNKFPLDAQRYGVIIENKANDVLSGDRAVPVTSDPSPLIEGVLEEKTFSY